MPTESEDSKNEREVLTSITGTQASMLNLNAQLLNKLGMEIENTDTKIHTQRRQVFYDFESDMFQNAKLFFLGNSLFIGLIVIIVYLSYRYFA